MWEMENETKTFHIPFFTATEKSKMENGCPFSIFHFPSAVENEINGMYTIPESPHSSVIAVRRIAIIK